MSPSPRIKEVGVGELARDASKLIRAAESGERLIVTRHGDPVAVIFSIDNAVEFLIAYSEEYAKARLDAGRFLLSRLEIRFTDNAARSLASLREQQRRRIEHRLGVLARELLGVDGPGAFLTGSWANAVGFLVDARAGTLTVHTVESHAEALRSLFGAGLDGRFRRRWWQKVLHGRR